MDREAFLDRIAERLGRARLHRAPAREVRGAPAFHRAGALPAGSEELLLQFERELSRVGGSVRIAEGASGVHAELRAELERWGATRIVTWARPELAGFELDFLWSEAGARAWGDPGLVTPEQLTTALLGAQVGVTAVDFAVADTGTLVLSAAPGRPRGVSLLPTVHVALVRASQLLLRMGQALEHFAAGGASDVPSLVQLITGPSRTSDIENDLTIGVHGPAAVTAIVRKDA